MENTKKINLSLETQHLHKLHQDGYTWNKVANIYQKSERTIYRWIKVNNQPKQKEGRKPKIDKNSLEILLDYVEKNNTATQQEMADYLTKQTNQVFSQQIVSLTLKRENITRKKVSYQYSEQLAKSEDIKWFKDRVRLLSQPHILALDECSFHLNEVPRYGYSLKGSRAISQRPGKRGSNYTLILCIQNIDKKGVINYELIEGSAKSQSFHDFLAKVNLSDKAKHYLILDNARVHVAKKSCEDLGLPTVKEFMISRNIQLNYLPPYTPELNPVELCFNFLRQQIEKNRPRTYEELKLAIDKTVNILNQKDLTEYFRHCFDYGVSGNTDISSL